MPSTLRLVAAAGDAPGIKEQIRAAIVEAGGQVEWIARDRTRPGTSHLTFAVRIEEPWSAHGIAVAVERLRGVAVVRMTEPPLVRGLL